jgi:hypothetical protein
MSPGTRRSAVQALQALNDAFAEGRLRSAASGRAKSSRFPPRRRTPRGRTSWQ